MREWLRHYDLLFVLHCPYPTTEHAGISPLGAVVRLIMMAWQRGIRCILEICLEDASLVDNLVSS